MTDESLRALVAGLAVCAVILTAFALPALFAALA